ncbi:MAG: hypothetical protein JXR05_17265 [Flavobacteriaceae bacterium]
MNNNIHLTINSQQNFLDESVEEKFSIILGTLYRSYYYSSSVSATGTEISITLKTSISKWDSKKYNLNELAEMFELK